MTDVALDHSGRDLPRPITDKLQDVLSRRRRVIIMRGVLALASVVVGSILAAMAIDAIFAIMSTVIHWIVLLAVIGLSLGTAYWFLVRPLVRRMDLARIAQVVESDHPEFEERLSSAVEILSSRDRSEFLGSQQLIARLTEEASQEAAVVDPGATFNIRFVQPYLIAACATVAALGGIWAMWPRQAGQLMVRVVSPSGGHGTLGSEHLMVRPGNKIAMVGETFAVDVVSERSISSAELIRSDSEERIPMIRAADEDGNDHFTIAVPCAESSFDYRVLVNGRIQSDLYSVTVSPKPVLIGMSFAYHPDPYTGLKDSFEEAPSGDIEQPPGTSVVVSGIFNKPIESAELRVNGGVEPVAISADGKNATWTIKMGNGDGQWSIQTVDRMNFQSDLITHKIKVRPDTPPSIMLTQPKEKQLHVSPTDKVTFDYSYTDDYGVSQIAFVLDIKDRPRMDVPITSGLSQRSAPGRGVLDIASLPPGIREITVKLRVRDNLPPTLGGAQEAFTEERTVLVDQPPSATSYEIQRLERQSAKVEASIRECIQLLTQVREWMRQARPLVESEPRPAADPLQLGPQSTQFITLGRTNGTKCDEILQRIVSDEAGTEFQTTAFACEGVRQGPVAMMNWALDSIRLSDKKDAQVANVVTADKNAEEAIAALTKLLETLKQEKTEAQANSELANEVLEAAQDQQDIKELDQKPVWDQQAISEYYDHLMRTQTALAAKAQQMSAKVSANKMNPSGQQHNEAAQAARNAANNLDKEDYEKTIKDMQEAENKFGETAKSIEEKGPKTPEAESVAEWNKELGAVQKNVKEQLQLLKEGKPDEALAKAQQGMSEQAKRLAEKAKEQEEKQASKPSEGGTSAQSPKSPGKIKNPGPGQSLDDAAKKSAQASSSMSTSKKPGSVSPMKVVDGPQAPSEGGGKSPEKGGQGTKGGGSNTGAGNSKNPSQSQNNNQNNTIGKGKNLGKAYIDKDSDLTQQGPPAKGGGSGVVLMEGAEEALRKAAGMLQQNPESKGFGGLMGGPNSEDTPPGPENNTNVDLGQQQDQNPQGEGQQKDGQSNKPGQPGNKPGKGGRGGTGKTGRPGEMIEGVSSSDWLRLPSELRDDIMQSSDADVPEEYRDLVNRYFQNLSRNGVQNDKK